MTSKRSWLGIVLLGALGCGAPKGAAPGLLLRGAAPRRPLPELVSADATLVVYVPSPQAAAAGVGALLGRLGEEPAVAHAVARARAEVAAWCGVAELSSVLGLGIDPVAPAALAIERGRPVLRVAVGSQSLLVARFDAVQRRRGATISTELVGAQAWRVGTGGQGAAMAMTITADGAWATALGELPEDAAPRAAVLAGALDQPARSLAGDATFAAALGSAPGSPFALLKPGLFGIELDGLQALAVGVTPAADGLRVWFEAALGPDQRAALGRLARGGSGSLVELIGADALVAAKGELSVNLVALGGLRRQLAPRLAVAQRWLGRIGLGKIDLEDDLLGRVNGHLAAAVYMPGLDFFVALPRRHAETLLARLPAALSARVRDPAAVQRALAALFGPSSARRGLSWGGRPTSGRMVDVRALPGGRSFRALTPAGDTLIGAAVLGDLLVVGSGEGFDRTLEVAEGSHRATITDADLPDGARDAFQADDGSILYSTLTPAAGIIALAPTRGPREATARGVATQVRDVAVTARFAQTGFRGHLQLRLRPR